MLRVFRTGSTTGMLASMANDEGFLPVGLPDTQHGHEAGNLHCGISTPSQELVIQVHHVAVRDPPSLQPVVLPTASCHQERVLVADDPLSEAVTGDVADLRFEVFLVIDILEESRELPIALSQWLPQRGPQPVEEEVTSFSGN